MFLCAYTSDGDHGPGGWRRSSEDEFKPTPEQVEAFARLAKLKEKFKSYTPYRRRLTEADSYMLRMADMDLQSAMFGEDFNGNESDMDEW